MAAPNGEMRTTSTSPTTVPSCFLYFSNIQWGHTLELGTSRTTHIDSSNQPIFLVFDVGQELFRVIPLPQDYNVQNEGL